jgi:hypothetical protein
MGMSRLRGLESYVVVCDEIEDQMHWDIRYEYGHPAGYTDDLGIIADRDQWVDEVIPGWYARNFISQSKRSWVNTDSDTAMREWCEENLKGYWEIKGYVLMTDPDDVTLFKMRWM